MSQSTAWRRSMRLATKRDGISDFWRGQAWRRFNAQCKGLKGRSENRDMKNWSKWRREPKGTEAGDAERSEITSRDAFGFYERLRLAPQRGKRIVTNGVTEHGNQGM